MALYGGSMRTFYKEIEVTFVYFDTTEMDAERIREHVLDAHMAGLKKGLAIISAYESIGELTDRLSDSLQAAEIAISDAVHNLHLAKQGNVIKELEAYWLTCHHVAEEMLEAVAKGIPFCPISYRAFCTAAYEHMYQESVPVPWLPGSK